MEQRIARLTASGVLQQKLADRAATGRNVACIAIAGVLTGITLAAG